MSELEEVETVQRTQPKVRWGLGMTVNLGDFESFRLECSVEDYKRADESMKQSSERVFNFVHAQLVKKVTQVRSELQ